MESLRSNVLGELGEKLERGEDLEIPLRARFEAIGLRVRESPASVLLRLVDHLTCVVHRHESRQTKGAPRHVLHQMLDRAPGRPQTGVRTDQH